MWGRPWSGRTRRATKAASRSGPVRPSDCVSTRSRTTVPPPTSVSDLARNDQLGSLPAGGPASKAGRLTQSPPREDALHVEVRSLPHLHRLYQLDGGEGVVGPRPPHGDERTTLSQHACSLGAELGVEELPLELDGGENAEEAFAQGDEGEQQHYRVGGEVVRLETVELQEGPEKNCSPAAPARTGSASGR